MVFRQSSSLLQVVLGTVVSALLHPGSNRSGHQAVSSYLDRPAEHVRQLILTPLLLHPKPPWRAKASLPSFRTGIAAQGKISHHLTQRRRHFEAVAR